ncbi:MAG TPA: hypothetical protein VIJ28_18045 [Chloroflexota bacterium]|jgi:hypothetical protein
MNRDIQGGLWRRLRGAAAMIILLTLAVQIPRGAGQALATTTPPAAKALPGWPGGLASYQGRYKLTTSASAGFAKSGELTIFGRVVHGLKGLQLSGILAVYATDGSSVLYLTRFVHSGSKLSATLHAGIYTGPTIGKFNLITRKGAVMVTELVLGHGAAIRLGFTEISNNPHP